MRLSKRSAPAIIAAATLGLPSLASAAPDVPRPDPIFPPPASCTVVAPVPGQVKIVVSPGKVREGTTPKLKYAITNRGKTCLGIGGAPYGLQQSGFAGWSDVTWDTGIWPAILRILKPGQTITGTTTPLPANLGAGGFYRVIPKFSPDAKEPVASAPLDVV